MAERRVAMCAENEALASYLFHKWQEMAKNEKFPENTQITLSKAYKNLCDFKDPIRDLRDAKNIKGIGRWTLTLIKDFFKSDDDAIPSSQEKTSGQTDKPTKNSRRYLPQKGSAPYAILITLYIETIHKGKEFMRKQELIDAAEISGLSKNAIGPSKSGAPSGNFGAQVKDWYCGWNSMKTLVAKGLVVKSSCPAKYMLTEEGIKTGQECAQRSGLISEAEPMILSQPSIDSCLADVIPVVEFPSAGNIEAEKPTNSKRRPRIKPCTTKRTFSTSSEDRQIEMLAGAVDKNQSSDTSDELMPSFQNEYSIYSSQLKCNERDNTKSTVDHSRTDVPESTLRPDNVMTEVRPCTFTTFQEDPSLNVESNIDSIQSSSVVMLATPPLENNCFSETYNVILILDDREQFAHDKRGNNSRSKVAEHLHSMFNIEVEVRRLPIGDATWIARHKTFGQEYVLDFIVERKKVNDLSISIKDNRYRDQKLRLMRCGIQRLIYLIEGDPNLIDASESIKSAAMTTEILEGFDVQRTKDLSATIRKYGNLTKAIAEVYNMISLNRNQYKSKPCMTYDGFVKKCRDLEKETVSDVFGVQLMQVPQVTEDIALAVLDHYPTVLSLAKAYASLEGDKLGQENLLKDIPIRNKSKTIGSTASKRIYNLIWGDGQ